MLEHVAKSGSNSEFSAPPPPCSWAGTGHGQALHLQDHFMAAATPPVVSSRLGEQAAMQLSCILEVFDWLLFVPVLDLEMIEKVSI